jgi:MSHA biogenesis protein MshP
MIFNPNNPLGKISPLPLRGRAREGVETRLSHHPNPHPNGHGKDTTLGYETCHARFPHLNPLPLAGEEANESLREFHVNLPPTRGKKRFCSNGLFGLNSAIVLPSREQGFSLISAIFLVVVIAVLSTFAVTLSTTQQQSAALDMLGLRAYQAARAGIEWGAFQITHSSVAGTGFAAGCQSAAVASQVPTLPAAQLSVFSVGITCGATSYVDGVSGVLYELTSTASGVNGATPGSPDYVERKIRATIAQ